MPSVNANFARWQFAQAIVLSADSRLSKNNIRPSSTFSTVIGLSLGMTTALSSKPKGILSLYSVAVAARGDNIATELMAKAPRKLLRNRDEPPSTGCRSSLFGTAGFIVGPFLFVVLSRVPFFCCEVG